MGIKFAPAKKTTQHTQSDPMDPRDTAEGNGEALLVTADGLPSTLNKVLLTGQYTKNSTCLGVLAFLGKAAIGVFASWLA